MALKDNNPTFSYVSWTDLLITYDGTTYNVQNSHTNMKYIYWDVTNPYVLQCYNRTQQQYPGYYQMFINDNGISTQRTHEDLVITFDGNNSDLISSQIFGLHETNKEFGSKFVAIETDIDGLKQIVGEGGVGGEGNHDTIWEKISQIEQTSSSIDLSVKELTKEFSDDKEVRELRENINKSIIECNSNLGIFKSEISTYYKDKKIDSEEKIKINTHLDILDKAKSEVLKNIAIVESILTEQGQTTELNKLVSARTKFSNSISNLRTYITTAISDNTVVPSEVTMTTDLFAKCNVSINELSRVCDDVIFLGAGGKISEELARIGLKSDEIILSVSKTEESILNNISIEKNLFQGQITDFKNVIDKLTKALHVVSEDGNASVEEIQIINEIISEVELEKKDIEDKYNELYNHIHISESEKIRLGTEYEKFNNKYTELLNKINSVLADGFFNSSEVVQVDTLINETLTCLSGLHSTITQCMDDILLNTQRAEVQAAKDALQNEIKDVDNRLNGLDGYINGTFENNVIDQAERKAIEQTLEGLKTEKTDIDSNYNQLMLSKYLDGQLKIDFENAYNILVSKYDALVLVINNILSKTDLINDLDRTNMNNAKLSFNEQIGEFTKMINMVIEYIGEKQSASVITDFDKQLQDLNTKVDTILDDVGGAVADGIIDETERIAIKQSLKTLELDFIENEVEYLKVYEHPNLIGNIKVELNNVYTTYAAKYNNLIATINKLLDKVGNIDDLDRQELDVAYMEYGTAIRMFLFKLKEAINSISDKSIEDAKNEINKEIEDLNNSLLGLEEVMNGVFKDGILSESEKLAIKQSLQPIHKDKLEVDEKHKSLYSNVDLLGAAKDNLLASYNIYVTKYNNLIKVVDEILNKTGILDNTDQTKLNSAFTEYRTASATYAKRVNEAIDSIAKVKADKAEESSKKHTEAQIKLVNDAISLKVSQTEYNGNNTIINQKFTEVKQTTDSITSSVSDLNKGQSQLTQRVDGFEFRFENSGKPNELVNADFSKGLDNWIVGQISGGLVSHHNVTTFSGCPYTGGISLSQCTQLNASAYVKQTIKPNSHNAESFTISAWAFDENIEYLSPAGGSYSMANFYFTVNYKNGKQGYFNGDIPRLLGSKNKWKRVSAVFYRNKDYGEIDSIDVHVYMRNAKGRLYISQIQFEEGEFMSPWKPSDKQLYNNITTIDGTGVTVTHKDGTYSQMGEDGFKHYKGSNGRLYHHMSATGNVSNLQGQSSQWVDLVAVTGDTRWRNKPNLQVTAYIHDISHPNMGYALKTCGAKVLDLDRVNGKFRVYNETNAVYYVDGTHLVNVPASITWIAFA